MARFTVGSCEMGWGGLRVGVFPLLWYSSYRTALCNGNRQYGLSGLGRVELHLVCQHLTVNCNDDTYMATCITIYQ